MRPPEFARHWARELGTNQETLVFLKGGINNQVFLCGNKSKQWVIKGYKNSHATYSDRMRSEVDFIKYANKVAPGRVPELIDTDIHRHCIILEYIEGKSYSEDVAPLAEDIKEAEEFFKALNSDLDLARQMIHKNAGEGFLSLKQHMENVRKRLTRMKTEHLPYPHRQNAEGLLRKVKCTADRVGVNLEMMIDSGLVEDRLNEDMRCVSPSDFGFHNAIRNGQRVVFIDFEFAGWDDPVKASIDFALQPRVPTMQDMCSLLKTLNKDTSHTLYQRQRAATPVLMVKWMCIMLSILEEGRLVSILENCGLSNQDAVIASRLEKAKHLMARLGLYL